MADGTRAYRLENNVHCQAKLIHSVQQPLSVDARVLFARACEAVSAIRKYSTNSECLRILCFPAMFNTQCKN